MAVHFTSPKLPDVLLFDGLPEIRLSDEIFNVSRLQSNMKKVVSSNSVISEISNGVSTLWSRSESYASLPESGSLTPPKSPLTSDPSHLERLYNHFAEVDTPRQSICEFVVSQPDSLSETTRKLATPIEHSRPSRPVSDFRKFKTSLCKSYLIGIECPFGANCIFAHGETELRSETNNETLKLANELIDIAQEPTRRHRTRRRRKAKAQCDADECEGAEATGDQGAPAGLPQTAAEYAWGPPSMWLACDGWAGLPWDGMRMEKPPPPSSPIPCAAAVPSPF